VDGYVLKSREGLFPDEQLLRAMGYQMSPGRNVIVIAVHVVATTYLDGQHLPKEGYHGRIHGRGGLFLEFDA